MKKIPLTALFVGGAILLFSVLILVLSSIGGSKSRQIAYEFVKKFTIRDDHFSCIPEKLPERNRSKVFILEEDFMTVSRQAREFLEKREFSEVESSQQLNVFRSRDNEVDIYVLIPNLEKYGSPDNKPLAMIVVEYRENSLIGDLLYDKLHVVCREF